MLDFPIVDAHHHVWDLRARYAWLQDPVNLDRFTDDDTSIRHDYLREDYLADAAPLQLAGSVHVEAGASDSLREVEFVEAQEGDTAVTAAVAGADLASPDAPALLEALSQRPIVRGIRHILNWHPDPNFTYTDNPTLISDAGWLAGFARLEPLGLSFDLQIYPEQLLDGARLAAEHPAVPIILNHTGMPWNDDAEHREIWRSGMIALAAQPNASVKISGLGMTHHDWTVESIRPYVLDTIEIFGPNRAMFASNFPVDRLYSTMPAIYAAFDEITSDLDRETRLDLFARNAMRIYRMGEIL